MPALWGIAGVLALLGNAIYRLTPYALDLANQTLGPVELVVLVGSDRGHLGVGHGELRGRRRQLEVAIDGLAERFGVNVVKRAEDLTKPAATPLASTLDYLDDQN